MSSTQASPISSKMQDSNYNFVAPSSTCHAQEDLLFFDTFSHSVGDKFNFDLVQFPSPVIIDLIKIVPLGQPIEANIPGNVRLGATNPSNCEVEFFINDLTKQDAHTMTDLGKLNCSEKKTDFSPPIQIQTDGLLLRGSYRTLTLAIFGQIASYEDKIEEPEQPVMSAASPPAQTPASPVMSEHDLRCVMRPIEPMVEPKDDDDQINQYEDESMCCRGPELIRAESPIDQNEPIGEPTMDMIESNASASTKDRVNPEDLSGSEMGVPSTVLTPNDKRLDYMEHSNCTVTDNAQSDRRSTKDEFDRQSITYSASKNTDQKDEDFSDDDEFREWEFNPETYRPNPLIYLANPSLTLQERNLMVIKKTQLHSQETTMRDIAKVEDAFTEATNSDDWVPLVEELTNDIANMSLCQTIDHPRMLNFLVNIIIQGLDLDAARAQKQTGYKVRHLKAGIKLAALLFHCGKAAVQAMLNASIPRRLLELYEGDQMSLPVRLLILRCLSAACDNIEGIEHMTSVGHVWSNTQFTYNKVSACEYARSTAPCEEPSMFESKSSSLIPPKLETEHADESQEPAPEVIKTEANAQEQALKLEDDKPLTCYQHLVLILISQPETRVRVAIGNLIKKIRLYENLSELTSYTIDILDNNDDCASDGCESEADKLVQIAKAHSNIIPLLQDVVNLTSDKCAQISQPIRRLPVRIQFQSKINRNDAHFAVYKWVVHFKILEFIDILLKSSSVQIETFDSTSSSTIERSVKIRTLCVAFIQQILELPSGTQLFLSSECHELAANILKSLAERRPIKRTNHLRLSDGIEDCLSATLRREEYLSISSCRDLSLRLAYSFKVLNCIDELFQFHRDLVNTRSSGSSIICEPEKVLHQLYILSDHPYGLAAILKHFSCIGNLDSLLRFLDMPDYHKQLEFVKETTIDYALELIGSFLRLNENVLSISDEYLVTILELCKTKEKNLSVRIKSLLPWMTPFDTNQAIPFITYSDESFKQLIRVIRKSIPDCSIPFAKDLDFELPPHMITAVRILRQLCIPPQVETYLQTIFDPHSMHKVITCQNNKGTSFMAITETMPYNQFSHPNQAWNLIVNQSSRLTASIEDSTGEQLSQISSTFKLYQPYNEDICGELKFHYGIMQVYEQDGLRRLLNTLRELVGNYPRPVYQSAALCGFRGRIVLSHIHSVVILLHSIVCHLIDARGSEFKDTSVISVILETYSLLCFVPKPSNQQEKRDQTDKNLALGEPVFKDIRELQRSTTMKSDNYQVAQQTKKLIISILMSYTQMCLSVSESEEKVISKSLWTKVLREIVDFTLSAPIFFQHGLDVLTKLLPSPLPCASIMDSIDQEQLFKNINHRKLWSAHLHPLHQQLERLISIFAISYHREIRSLLYYLCNQLCDLSSNTACMVVKSLMDAVVDFASKMSKDISAPGYNHNASPGDGPNKDPNASGVQKQQQRSGSVSDSKAQIASSTDAINNYGVKAVFNMISTLITNQAFETALTNNLHGFAKKDEKQLLQLLGILNKVGLLDAVDTSVDEQATFSNTGSSSVMSTCINQVIAKIKSNNEAINQVGVGLQEGSLTPSPSPPDELTRINLLELARTTPDRFNLAAGLKKTYRLKVLLDMDARTHRAKDPPASNRFTEPFKGSHADASASHKVYSVPARASRGRSSRPDAFRSRPQNTSRPPSIHVDDFVGLYGDNGTPYGLVGAANKLNSASSSLVLDSYGRLPKPPAGPIGSSSRAMPPVVEMSPTSERYYGGPRHGGPPPESMYRNSMSGGAGRANRRRSKHK